MKPVLAACATCDTILLLQACSVALPVRGQLVDSTETFSGTGTGQIDGAGTLVAVTSAGARREGDFVYVTRREGSRAIKCDDGRGGSFTFVSTVKLTTGKGTLDGKTIVFTFR